MKRIITFGIFVCIFSMAYSQIHNEIYNDMTKAIEETRKRCFLLI